MSIRHPRFFVSYRRDDAKTDDELALVNAIVNAVTDTFGEESCYLDTNDIKPGTHFPTVIQDELAACDSMIAIIGPAWLESVDRLKNPEDYVRRELEAGLERGIPVLPLLVGQVQDLSKANALPAPLQLLATRNFVKQDTALAHDESHGLKPFADALRQLDKLFISMRECSLPNRSKYFVTRKVQNSNQSVQDSIHSFLHPSAVPVVIVGAPGIGKSTEVLTYAYRHLYDYSSIFYARADEDTDTTRQSNENDLLRQGLQAILSVIDAASGSAHTGSSVETLGLKELISLAAESVSRQTRYLLILDNLNDAELIKQCLAAFRGGHVLITTQSRPPLGGSHAQFVDVKQLAGDEGVNLLSMHFGQNESWRVDDNEVSACRNISAALSGHPIAIAIAGAFMTHDMCPPTTYWHDHLKAAELGSLTAQAMRAYSAPAVLQTFKIAYNRLLAHSASDPVATACVNLLNLCSYFGPDIIPESLLREVSKQAAKSQGPGSGDTYRKAVDLATDLSLIDKFSISNPGSVDVRMHQLLREASQEVTGDETHSGGAKYDSSDSYPEQVVKGINRYLGRPDAIADDRFRMMIPHMREALRLKDSLGIRVRRNKNRYSLIDYKQDLDVLDRLRTGKWRSLFDVGDEPSYADLFNALHLMEQAGKKKQIHRILLSVRRVVPDVREQMRIFSCLFLLVHYWWDCYLQDQDFCKPLLSLWRTDAPHSAKEDEFDRVLTTIYVDYPRVSEYRARSTETEKWGRILDSITSLRDLLGLDDNASSGSLTTDSPIWRYLRAMTNMYLAEAMRYAKGIYCDHTLQGNELRRLYAEAGGLFQSEGDYWNGNWNHFELAEALREAGDHILDSNDVKASMNLFSEAEGQCQLALAGVLEEGEPSSDSDETSDECWIDGEVASNIYRIYADIYRSYARTDESGSYDRRAWSAQCIAILFGYAYLFFEGDAYAMAFYQEQVDRILDAFQQVPEASKKDVEDFCTTFWQPLLSSVTGVTHRGRLPFIPALPHSVREISGRSANPKRKLLNQMKTHLASLGENSGYYQSPYLIDKVSEYILK